MIAFLDLLDTEEEKSKFKQLYNKYIDLLMWIAMDKLQNYHLAEEAVQDALFYIAKNFDKVGEVESKVTKGYLSTIIQGFAINKFNKEKKVTPLPAEYDGILSFDCDDEKFFDSMDALDLKFAIDNLSDESRNYLYLTYVYGYTSKEIGDMYKISPDLVRKKIQFAKRDVRKYYENGVTVK